MLRPNHRGTTRRRDTCRIAPQGAMWGTHGALTLRARVHLLVHACVHGFPLLHASLSCLPCLCPCVFPHCAWHAATARATAWLLSVSLCILWE
eukprot:2095327-Prorocentrum_lima.AAC.1